MPSGELPSAEELHDAIENSDKSRVRDIRDDLVEDEEIKLRERGINPYYSEKSEDHSFCQFTYRGDRENSTTTWDGVSSDTDTEADDTPVQPLVFYFDNGQYAYSIENYLRKKWIPNFIGQITKGEDLYETSEDLGYTQQDMTDLYNKYEYISKFKFDPVEGNKLDEDSPLAKAMNQLTEQTSGQTFSGG